MPFGDGTGPAGAGPMTGRGLGRCAGYPSPGYAKRGFGRGYFGRGGRGLGYGRGYGRGMGWYNGGSIAYEGGYPQIGPRLSKDEEKKALNEELDYLRDNLKTVEKRIQELEGKKKK